MRETVKIVGIKKQPKSTDPSVIYYNYYYTSPFKQYDIDNADCAGIVAGREFASVDIGCKVGDEVIFYYDKGYQDKATLVGCQIIKSASSK